MSIFSSMPTIPRGMKMMNRIRQNAVDRVGGADEVGAEADAQALVQRNREQRRLPSDRAAAYMPPAIAAKTICSETATPETVSGLRYMKYCP